MLSTARCKLVGRELKSRVEIVYFDVLDQAKEVEME